MRTIKLILLGMAFAVFLAFVVFNPTEVVIRLAPKSFHADEIVIQLPALVLLAFLAGFLPTYLMHLASRTLWRRKHARLEKDLALAAPVVPPAIATPQP